MPHTKKKEAQTHHSRNNITKVKEEAIETEKKKKINYCCNIFFCFVL